MGEREDFESGRQDATSWLKSSPKTAAARDGRIVGELEEQNRLAREQVSQQRRAEVVAREAASELREVEHERLQHQREHNARMEQMQFDALSEEQQMRVFAAERARDAEDRRAFIASFEPVYARLAPQITLLARQLGQESGPIQTESLPLAHREGVAIALSNVFRDGYGLPSAILVEIGRRLATERLDVSRWAPVPEPIRDCAREVKSLAILLKEHGLFLPARATLAHAFKRDPWSSPDDVLQGRSPLETTPDADVRGKKSDYPSEKRDTVIELVDTTCRFQGGMYASTVQRVPTDDRLRSGLDWIASRPVGLYERVEVVKRGFAVVLETGLATLPMGLMAWGRNHRDLEEAVRFAEDRAEFDALLYRWEMLTRLVAASNLEAFIDAEIARPIRALLVEREALEQFGATLAAWREDTAPVALPLPTPLPEEEAYALHERPGDWALLDQRLRKIARVLASVAKGKDLNLEADRHAAWAEFDAKLKASNILRGSAGETSDLFKAVHHRAISLVAVALGASATNAAVPSDAAGTLARLGGAAVVIGILVCRMSSADGVGVASIFGGVAAIAIGVWRHAAQPRAAPDVKAFGVLPSLESRLAFLRGVIAQGA